MRFGPFISFGIALLLVVVNESAQSENPMPPEIQALWAPLEAAQKAVAADRDKKLANLD